ncbi:UNVERIFIED_CONTAM: hypothetical protein PYX00_005853 [Menopon gallinae]|uniref:Beta-1,4-glucuronyltransferase 1 n=1 Tax=Menopon gallinae TaxID=328185 RepID=A0AAW2HTM8_9NEOP
MCQTPCRLRVFSLGSFLLLLFSNIWLIVRLLNANQCPAKKSEEPANVENFQRIIKDVEPEEARPCKEAEPKPSIQEYDAQEVEETGFNVNFLLGRWDKHHLFKMYDYVYVGQNFSILSERFAVCMATQSSLEKLHSIVQVAYQWTGPISAAVYAAGDDEYFLLHWYVNFLKKCFASIRDRVSFHLLVPKNKLPTGKYPARLRQLAETKHECRKPEAVLKEILKLRSSETTKWRTKSVYPQNHMRNLARKNCQSFNVFLTDIDIIPSWNLADGLDRFLKSTRRRCIGKCAYVIPTYELDDRAMFPRDKKDLIRLAKKGLARAFHQKVFIYNQYATNFSRWEAFPDLPDKEVVVSHNVTNFEFLYEPFYVAPDTVPEHDERFMGYGYTRNSQVYEMFVAGYQFEVLSPIFTIHWGLQGRKGRPPWRERQNSLNRREFEVFKREVFARYDKDPLKML